MNIKEILKTTLLSPLEAEILLSFAINKAREYLFAHPENKLSPAQITKFKKLAARRMKKEPIAYITGKKEFLGLDFAVNENVLIPRPETELLVEKALDLFLKVQPFSSRLSREARFPKVEPLSIIDVGTGSGNIIISIVKNLPADTRKKINFYAVDISKKAVDIAKKNARKHKVSKYIKFIKSDLLQFVRKEKIEGNILIVANLPYLSDVLYRQNEENLKYEPKTAIASKNNGLNHYSRLFSQIRQLLGTSCVERVACFAEISPEQRNTLERIVKNELSLPKISFSKDLSGKTRTVKIEALFPAKLTNIHKS